MNNGHCYNLVRYNIAKGDAKRKEVEDMMISILIEQPNIHIREIAKKIGCSNHISNLIYFKIRRHGLVENRLTMTS